MLPLRVCRLYQFNKVLGQGSFSEVYGVFHLTSGGETAIKVEMPPEEDWKVATLPYEAAIHRHLRGHYGFPSIFWSGMDGGAHVIVMERLGATIEDLRRLCRGHFSMKTICMLAEQMITRIEFAHSRGIIIRDVKPHNFAMGIKRRANLVYLFDLGLGKLYVDPTTGQHKPFREGLVGVGTVRYASANVHAGKEQGRRDDIIALGHNLLYLLHGRLPWQGIYAPSIEAKLRRIWEMKEPEGKVMREFIARSPPEFSAFFNHCYSLRDRMKKEGWSYDWRFDWLDPSGLEAGTLMADCYKIDERFVNLESTELPQPSVLVELDHLLFIGITKGTVEWHLLKLDPQPPTLIKTYHFAAHTKPSNL
ncbi:Casein kinase I [Grifola frondosa]|uniref:Casein kinase I n=1 Tax=Grifola frondosa TaxID=5627 RepID=A0A1C7LKK4_GRIFR|nr:Casein kinase I [Grifola frondosa]